MNHRERRYEIAVAVPVVSTSLVVGYLTKSALAGILVALMTYSLEHVPAVRRGLEKIASGEKKT